MSGLGPQSLHSNNLPRAADATGPQTRPQVERGGRVVAVHTLSSDLHIPTHSLLLLMLLLLLHGDACWLPKCLSLIQNMLSWMK